MNSKRVRLPSACVDEHIAPGVIAALRRTLRTTEAGRREDLRGRDERSYIGELLSENSIFVTSDLEFVEYVRDHEVRHAGIIFIHGSMANAEKESFAEVASIIVRGACRSSSRAFRNRIVYPAPEGIRLHELHKGQKLVMSYDWMRDLYGLPPEVDLDK